MKVSLDKLLITSGTILTEGAILERIRRFEGIRLDPFINHAGLIYQSPDLIKQIYTQYIEIARRYDLPLLIMTPTRKVNYETVSKSKFAGKDILRDSSKFIDDIRIDYPDFTDKIYIGGLLGCRGDAYKANEGLSRSYAKKFHSVQVKEFSRSCVDFLFAGIMPCIEEAIGMAEAMAGTGIPYIISFMIRKEGTLLDGTSISNAIELIDNEVYPRPVCYMSNCVHPFNLKLALTNKINHGSVQLERFKGIQANTSRLSPEELNNRGTLDREDFDEIVDEMKILKDDLGFRIFGGCCGTDDVFLEKLTIMLSKEKNR